MTKHYLGQCCRARKAQVAESLLQACSVFMTTSIMQVINRLAANFLSDLLRLVIHKLAASCYNHLQSLHISSCIKSKTHRL